jgi:hypothetical protein
MNKVMHLTREQVMVLHTTVRGETSIPECKELYDYCRRELNGMPYSNYYHLPVDLMARVLPVLKKYSDYYDKNQQQFIEGLEKWISGLSTASS